MTENIETEVKIEIDRSKKFDEIYEAIGQPNWNIQRNYVFSFGGNILRLRYEANKAFLTAKGKNIPCEFKKRQEFECEIPTEFYFGFSKLAKCLSQPIYYEKSRASAKFNGCTVCLDNLGGSYYVEIEGNEEDIRKNISRLGLQDFPIEKRSYLEILMQEWYADTK